MNNHSEEIAKILQKRRDNMEKLSQSIRNGYNPDWNRIEQESQEEWDRIEKLLKDKYRI